MIHIVLRPRANDSIPLNNQRVNDFKDLAQLDGIKIAYDLYAGENFESRDDIVQPLLVICNAER